MRRHPQRSTLFPYTTLFRSNAQNGNGWALLWAAECGRKTTIQIALHEGIDVQTMTVCDKKQTALHLASLNKHRSEEHTSELQSPMYLVCRLLLEKKKKSNTE